MNSSAAFRDGDGQGVGDVGGERCGNLQALDVFHSMSVEAWEEELEWGYFCTSFDSTTQVPTRICFRITWYCV